MVPLIPNIDHIAITIDCIQAVLPGPETGRTQDVDPDGPRESCEFGRNRDGQSGLTALCDEDAIWRFSEHPGIAAEGKTLLGKWLMPPFDDVIRAGADRSKILR